MTRASTSIWFVLMILHCLSFDLIRCDINWKGQNWAMSCDFPGNDFAQANTRGEDCGGRCASNPKCTHFTWGPWNGGTCWMKTGSISKSDAVVPDEKRLVCGVVHRGGNGGETNRASSQRPFQQQMLAAHNRYRARHCAPSMRLDDELNRSAQAYAEELVRVGRLQHSKRNGIGENLYWLRSSAANIHPDGAAATRGWYDEVRLYDFNRPGFSMATGHFTQLVWKDSTRLGVGYAFTADKREIYVVAQYGPSGNSGRRFKDNVLPASC